MALTSSTNHLSPAVDTPAVDTGTLAAIRVRIEPRAGWWQFDFRPWHYWTAITSAVVIGVAFVALLATHGAIR